MACEDVNQLRQLIKAVAAQQAPNSGDSWIILELVADLPFKHPLGMTLKMIFKDVAAFVRDPARNILRIGNKVRYALGCLIIPVADVAARISVVLMCGVEPTLRVSYALPKCRQRAWPGA